MAEPLTVLRELSRLHRVAVTTLHSHGTAEPIYPAYETLAEHLHNAMMLIAAGTDPDAVVSDMSALWLELADDCDRQPRMLFGAWAGKLAGVLV